MRILIGLSFAVAMAAFSGCSSEDGTKMPAPFSLTEEAVGHYCGMDILEHDGPKGQIILTGAIVPIWFSSVRDAVAFTMLPDEPKDIAAIYVSDMAASPSWEQPGADNWIDAKKAFFVIGSQRRGGMGTAETVPFSTEAAARDFAGTHGGKVVRFSDIPADYALSGENAPVDPATLPQDHTGH